MIGAGSAIASVISSYQRKSDKVVENFKKRAETKKNELSSEKKEIIKTVDQQLQMDNLTKSDRICPECNRNFSVIIVHDLKIDSCRYCKSLWFDFGELKTLTGLQKDIPSDGLREKKSDYSCPVCNIKMYKNIFMSKSNLIIDLCREHGLYLENGELKRIFELSENNKLP